MRALFHHLTRNVVSLAGTRIATASALVFAPLFAIARLFAGAADPARVIRMAALRSFTRRDASSHLLN